MIYYTSKRLLSSTIPGIKGTINLKTDLLIGGKWQAAKDGRTFETIDPSTGKMIAKVASAGKADVDLAVKASQEAVKEWSKVSPSQRAKLIHKFADALENSKEELAAIESTDNGKPLMFAMHDLKFSASIFRYYAGACERMEG